MRKHLVLAFACMLAAPVLPADYQAGLDAYINGDYDTAITEWQAVVESSPGTVPDPVRAETLYAIGMLFWIADRDPEHFTIQLRKKLWIRRYGMVQRILE